MEPLLNIGDKIKLKWDSINGNPEFYKGTVISIAKQKKLKKGSMFKYELLLEDGDVIVTRLANVEWSLLDTENPKQGSKKRKNGVRNIDRIQLPQFKYICAPMVGASELAFRLLCRKYGTQLAYTPMMNSELFAIDSDYRKQEFQTTPEDRPLVAHFSGNNPEVMLQAARFVESRCDAIDLNLGCPQRVAYTGHFGSYLLGEEDRTLILSIVKTLSENLSLPIFVKIRLLDTVDDTIRLCRQLVEAGASLIAIHGRYRVNLVGRTGPGARDGPAHLDQIKTIKSAIPDIPIISNGNVITWDDVVNNLAFTEADGIMSAEGLLDNPALFLPQITENSSKFPDKLNLAIEYLDLVDKHPVKMKSIIFHIRRICKDYFDSFQLMDDCLNCKTKEEVRAVVEQAIHYRDTPGSYIYDSNKAKKAKEALERKKFEEGKRKRFEERMVRKAKREGRDDLYFYLQQGAEPPTIEEIKDLKRMPPDESFKIWKEKYSQHCYPYHFGKEKERCSRDRACAFLHADPSLGESLAFG